MKITLSQKIWSAVCLIILLSVFGALIWQDIKTVSADDEQKELTTKRGPMVIKTDARNFGLNGPVKYVEDDFMFETRMSFDREGRLTKIGYYVIEYDLNPNGIVAGGNIVRRDDYGRILWVGRDTSKGTEEGYHFEYNDNGLCKFWLLRNDEINCLTFTQFDDEGRPVAAGRNEDYNSTDFDVDIEYSYSKIDEYGNWRMCNVINDMGTRISEDNWRRTIKYYSSDQDQEETKTTTYERKLQTDNESSGYDFVCNRLLTEDDIAGKSSRELKIMRNWIFAKHGYKFKTADMKEFFEAQPWYEGRYDDVSSMLTDLERKNIAFIKRHE